jgi:two-component system chemotaxis sensor kinase CheA
MAIELTQFHDYFFEESFEALGRMEQALLRLDAAAADAELINTVFRVAHSIKGGAATFGFGPVSSFTHSLESVLDALRARRLQVTSALSDLLLRSVDLMREMLRAQQAGQPCDAQRVADLQFDLEVMLAREAAAPGAAFDRAEGDFAPGVSVLEHASPIAGDRPSADTTRASGSPAGGLPNSGDAASIRVGIDKIEQLMNSVGELVITQSMLAQSGALLEGAAGQRLRGGLAQLGRDVRALQESVIRVRMVPISFLFGRFPRMARDLGQRLGKQVEVRMTGGETELDRMVLEKIGDPLTHLVRNCIDHGIEAPQQRQASGKHACGTVHLHACQRGGSIIVEVSDDGGGLQRERILAKARQRRLVGADEQPPDTALDNLIFLAGFSTQEQATETSGRGVGMDVVRRNIDELGGVIDVRSAAGKGTRFTITLPLTLALIEGQSVAVGDESYIVPLTAIVESLPMRTAPVDHFVGHGEVLSYHGEYLPLLRLDQMLQARCERPREPRDGLILVVQGDGRRVGLCVDELLGQQQVVLKTLQSNYGHIDGIAGATVLGDGSVTLILDVAALMNCDALLRTAGGNGFNHRPARPIHPVSVAGGRAHGQLARS